MSSLNSVGAILEPQLGRDRVLLRSMVRPVRGGGGRDGSREVVVGHDGDDGGRSIGPPAVVPMAPMVAMEASYSRMLATSAEWLQVLDPAEAGRLP